MRDIIRDLITSSARAEWLGEPLVGFADVNSDLIRELKKHTTPDHLMPEDILSGAKITVCYFLPFKKEFALTNLNSGSSQDDDAPSKTWVDMYIDTNNIIEKTNKALVSKINELGYSADYFKGGFDKERAVSVWSHRHVAQAAGLGTFGMNNLLITKKGSCGRFGSIVCDAPIKADEPLREELCLHKRGGSCAKCIERCKSGALTKNGFDRLGCFKVCTVNEELYGADVCGKCAVGIPCAFKGF